MSSGGPNKYPFNYGRGGPSQGPLASSKGSRSALGEDDELPPGSLVRRLNVADITASGRQAQMSNFQCIASYNWLDSSQPTILVPGAPAIWSPPAHHRKLEPDKGEVFIDQNAARYSPYPLEPTFRAIYEMHPELDLGDIDVVICRNTMAKLFDFVTTNSKTFELDVEVIGDKAVFIRKEKNTTEFINEFRGFGHTFPEEYTRWDNATKGSSSHHRVAECDFAGLKYLLRFESDGYLAKKASLRRHESRVDHGHIASSQISGELLTIGGAKPAAGHTLGLRKGGSETAQEAAIDIKTRAAHNVLDMDAVLPRLWMSQTPNLIVAYHKGGRFDDVRVLDVRKDLGKWEKKNSENLQKLDAVIRRIVDVARSTITMKCRVKRNHDGELEIWELGFDYHSALPDDLCQKLREEGVDTGSD